MTRRTLTSVVVGVLLAGLVIAAAFLPVPYVTMSPGPTVDVYAAGVSEEKPHYGTTTTDDGNYAVFAISAVRNGTADAQPANERNARQRQIAQQVGGEEFAAYVTEAERKVKIVRNEKVFE